ncbi:TPA: tRNA (cytidine(56)-2'-O)-methyltransferase [Candidatus Bathyarchaeota archaeon]|nr:tRNA (cytidine(56)-2'-O)-methyltransferase [Candidatus Bathyarchaeota archaeon]
MEVVVLRWGHRPRDARVTTHVALTARAFGASGLILSDVEDQKIEKSVEKVVESWGGRFFFKMGIPWRKAVEEWRREGGIVVHLTMYGENIEASDVLQRIRKAGRKLLVLVGSQKVPPSFFSPSVSDFNVAVGNQPHSEVAALAVFLDRLFEGRELIKGFEGAKLRVMPSKRSKKVAKG